MTSGRLNDNIRDDMEFEFSRQECINLESSLQCEWLETNGLGGYASSTVPGCNTRKHHGLLVAPVPEFDQRFVFLSKMEAAIAVRKHTFHLSTNQYPGAFHPTGHKYMERFQSAHYPMTLYRVGDILMRRSVLMVQGENTILLRYELLSADIPITLQLTPLLAFRACDELTKENDAFNSAWTASGTACRIQPYDALPPLYIDCSMDSDLVKGGNWMHNVEYFVERLRGLDYTEDLFAAGTFELNLQSGNTFVLRASLTEPTCPVLDQWKRELGQRQASLNSFRAEPVSIRALKSQADQFLIREKAKPLRVISSYPWGDYLLRDTMIASVGLTLGCGRGKDMANLIEGIGLRDPQDLLTTSTVDTSFWFAWMLHKYYKATDDLRTVHSVLKPVLIPCLMAIAEGKVNGCTVEKGSCFLKLDSDLTWMNRPTDGDSATPRSGIPVDTNALWYNALCSARDLCQAAGLEFPEVLSACITPVQAHYAKAFWQPELGYLADVLGDDDADTSIRPNQIMAVALDYPLLNSAQAMAVVSCVSANLLTPYGLRTLSPGDDEYMGRCDGTEDERMRAAHRGTVWPWLVSFYCDAALKVADNKNAEMTRLKQIFTPLFYAHIGQACIGSVSEAFNGDPPHDFRCAYASAIGVSETIRAWNILNKGHDI